ncbi:MAG: amino acid permease, partial [Burkholderiales bacterium]
MSGQDGNTTQAAARPEPVLELRDAIALIVGIVVGAGIFKAPSVVAANAGSAWGMLGAWVLGGIVSLIGALCYAELATSCPHAGGDYHFLTRAYGKKLSFMFAWARLAVITTGSIALLAFVFGDYCSRLYALGAQSSAIYAAMVVIVLTAVNSAGVKIGAATQNWLTALQLLGLLALALAAFVAAPAPEAL